jgi:hypothetical protein
MNSKIYLIAISLSILAFALFITGLSTAFENVIAQQDDSNNSNYTNMSSLEEDRIYPNMSSLEEDRIYPNMSSLEEDK